MIDWNKRSIISISSVPLWLKVAISEYQKRRGLQSWSQAFMEVAVESLVRQYVEPESEIILFGDREYESDAYEDFLRRYQDESTENLVEFWKKCVAPPANGGKRAGAGRKKLK